MPAIYISMYGYVYMIRVQCSALCRYINTLYGVKGRHELAATGIIRLFVSDRDIRFILSHF